MTLDEGLLETSTLKAPSPVSAALRIPRSYDCDSTCLKITSFPYLISWPALFLSSLFNPSISPLALALIAYFWAGLNSNVENTESINQEVDRACRSYFLEGFERVILDKD